MAKNGFRVFDSDIHIVEPDFGVDYIASRYKDRAPGLRNRTNDATRNVVSENFQVDGKVLAVWPRGGAAPGPWRRCTRTPARA